MSRSHAQTIRKLHEMPSLSAAFRLLSAARVMVPYSIIYTIIHLICLVRKSFRRRYPPFQNPNLPFHKRSLHKRPLHDFLAVICCEPFDPCFRVSLSPEFVLDRAHFEWTGRLFKHGEKLFTSLFYNFNPTLI